MNAFPLTAKEIFKKFIFQNILADGLGGSVENHRTILQKTRAVIETQGRVPLVFTEMNEKTFYEFKETLGHLGYVCYGASKGILWAPTPTKTHERGPDGVTLFLPTEMNDQVTVTILEMIPVSFEEKGKTKQTAAPIIKVTFSDGTYVVITHLKSKSDMSPVRISQLKVYGVILEDGSVDPLCVGIIGDLNEGLQMELQEGPSREPILRLKSPNPDEILVIQAISGAGMLPNLETHPPTNAKEAKTLQGDRYSGDTREASANGVAYSITDVMAFRDACVTVTTAPVPLTWDEWMTEHHSDHAMLFVELNNTE